MRNFVVQIMLSIHQSELPETVSTKSSDIIFRFVKTSGEIYARDLTQHVFGLSIQRISIHITSVSFFKGTVQYMEFEDFFVELKMLRLQEKKRKTDRSMLPVIAVIKIDQFGEMLVWEMYVTRNSEIKLSLH